MTKTFQIAVVLALLLIALATFRFSENGRYHYSTNGTTGIVIDTRTGEFWSEDGSHFEPRLAKITVQHPTVTDTTAPQPASSAALPK